MPYADIRQRIADILLCVEGVELVHQYKRDIREEKNFKKSMVVRADIDGKDRISAWEITRSSFIEDYASLSSYKATRQHNFEIFGYYSVNDEDASEFRFQDIIDRISDEFRGRDRLQLEGSPLTGVERSTLIGGVNIGHSSWGNYFVHSANLTLEINERLVTTNP